MLVFPNLPGSLEGCYPADLKKAQQKVGNQFYGA